MMTTIFRTMAGIALILTVLAILWHPKTGSILLDTFISQSNNMVHIPKYKVWRVQQTVSPDVVLRLQGKKCNLDLDNLQCRG